MIRRTYLFYFFPVMGVVVYMLSFLGSFRTGGDFSILEVILLLLPSLLMFSSALWGAFFPLVVINGCNVVVADKLFGKQKRFSLEDVRAVELSEKQIEVRLIDRIVTISLDWFEERQVCVFLSKIRDSDSTMRKGSNVEFKH